MQRDIFGDETPICRLNGKDVRYANRGIQFETLINATNDFYARQKLACMEKQQVLVKRIYGADKQLKTAFPAQKSSVDYLGWAKLWGDKATPCAIEAKHCAGKSVALNRLQPHQLAFMRKWGEGGLGIILVWLEGAEGTTPFGRAFAIPYQHWDAAFNASYPVPVDAMGMSWTTPGKRSLAAKDMLSEWEVDIGPYGVEWLETLKKWWF